MDFLPMPHEINRKDGFFQIRWNTPVVLQHTEPGALLWARMLKEEIRRDCGLEIAILRGEAPEGAIVLEERRDLAADHYEIRITAEEIRAEGGSDEALLHAVTTLKQWIRRHGALLPCLEIRDWPDLPHRGYYLDCSRGRIPTMDFLKKTVDLLCEYKINEFQLYIEHTYLFRDMSEVWRDDDPLEAEDILELDAYCRERHIELVPSLATFGHMFRILSSKSFCGLCELRDSDRMPYTYGNEMRHHTINSTHPEALPLVKKMILEYSALFTSKKFNICCDETFDLARDRSAAAAEKEGAQTLYVRYLGELCRWLLEQGITPVYWGDILAREPDSYDALPKGGICLNWGYAPDYPEDEIRELARMGAVQYACPGLSTWMRLIPLIPDSFSNIRCMCRYAHRYGAIGLLNTDWGDYGHVCPPEFTVPGILYGAAFSWNREEYSMEEMNEAVSFLAWGDRSGEFMRAVTAMSGNEAFLWADAMEWLDHEGEERQRVLERSMDSILTGREANARLEKAEEALSRAAGDLDTDRRSGVQTMLVAAEGVRMVNEFGLVLAERYGGKTAGAEQPEKLAEKLEKWMHEYIRCWRRTSRQSLLEIMRKKVDEMADELRK